jgi:hypothetical protein
MAWVADASATWDSLARSYRERIGERLAPAAVARQLADRLTADIDDPELRLRAIAEHVQSELSYQAIEFGRRAWLPDSFDTVVKNRFGDCKAHALFLHQLLTAGGFDAHLALVSTWSPVREDLPSLEAFDHMIVYVGGSSVDSGLQVARFLDATDKNTDALAAVPYGLAEAPALILDLESPRLVKIPGYPEDAAAVRTRATGHIERVKGSPLLRIVETVELAGLRSAGLRGMLRGVEATDLHNRLQGILFAHGNLVLTRARAENLEDPAAPLILHLEYDAPDAVVELDGRLLVSLPAPWEKDSLEVSPVEDRRSPFRIRSPLQVHRRFVLTLPEGHRSLSEEVRDRLTSHPYYKGEKILRKNEGTVQVETEVQFLPGRFESEHYADYCTGIRSLLSSLQHREILAPVN